METLKYRAMDLFRYTIPGLILLVAFSLFLPTIQSPKDVILFIDIIDLKRAIALFFISYFIGFCLDPLGTKIRFKIVVKLWNTGTRNEGGNDLTDNDRYMLIKRYFPDIYDMIEVWDMMKGMSQNLVIGVSTLFVASIYKYCNSCCCNKLDWSLLSVASALAIYTLLVQTKKFEQWSVEDMNATIRRFRLREKADNE